MTKTGEGLFEPISGLPLTRLLFHFIIKVIGQLGDDYEPVATFLQDELNKYPELTEEAKVSFLSLISQCSSVDKLVESAVGAAKKVFSITASLAVDEFSRNLTAQE